MDIQTARLGLPLLAPGQAGKEITHNEALAILDIVAAGVVRGVTRIAPAAPVAGECWIVAPGAGGDWAGRDGTIAGFTDGGWRFVDLPTGSTMHLRDDARTARRMPDGWGIGTVVVDQLVVEGQHVVRGRGAPVTSPAGGETVDVEARAALSALLERLRDHGLIAR